MNHDPKKMNKGSDNTTSFEKWKHFEIKCKTLPEPKKNEGFQKKQSVKEQ